MREKDYRFASFKKGQVKLLKFCYQIKYKFLFIYLLVHSTRTATKYDDGKPVQQSACA